jgi:plasmid replication initiation protein
MGYLDRNEQRASVTQDNKLVEASYTLTLNEKRLLLLGMSKIDPREFPTKNSPPAFSITVEEWTRRFPDDTHPWRAIKRASDSMLGRHVTLHPKEGRIKKLNWFDSVEYIEGEGRVEVTFGWSVRVLLGGLFEQFTKIDLLSVTQLRSFHSIRLYELLAQFKSTGYRVISLEDFRIAMDVVDSYPSTGELMRRVVNPALKELNEKSDFSVHFSQVKRGRKITAFQFVITVDEQPDFFKQKS